MQEETLEQYFADELELSELQEMIIEELDLPEDQQVSYHYQFRNLDSIIMLESSHFIQLCEAVVADRLEPRCLPIIAETLTQSEKFEWNDDVISEVLFFWLEGDSDFPLAKKSTHERFIRWLTGEEELPD